MSRVLSEEVRTLRLDGDIDHVGKGLTADQRQMLGRYICAKDPIQEIAEAFGTSPSEIETEISSGLKYLRDRASDKLQCPRTHRSCEDCGRKLRSHHSDVLCPTCVREQVSEFTSPSIYERGA